MIVFGKFYVRIGPFQWDAVPTFREGGHLSGYRWRFSIVPRWWRG